MQYEIPNVLIGRQKEKRTLLNIYDKVRAGGNEMVLVNGVAGIGKTAIVFDVASSVFVTNGFFVSGKCGQYLHNSPYDSIIQAFTQIIHQILTQDESEILQWKMELLASLGENGRLITEIIPVLEQIIGQQPECDVLNIRERRNRFHQVIKKFIRIFAKKDHPLVVFLDDIQWIDHASLSLMESVVTDNTVGYFYFIGAYRDDAVDDTHPLRSVIRSIEAAGHAATVVGLFDLNPQEINQLVGNFLKTGEAETLHLATVVWRKTGGNPFFINQFMNRLYETGLIHLDLEFGWKWDIEKINAIPATENVLALLKGKIDALTASEKMTLKLCACLGGSFEFDLLSRVGGNPVETVVSHLDSASQAGLVAVERDRGWFLHDKIMESIYSTIPLSERQAIHYRIGTTLLKITPPSVKTERVFSITDHLNHGAVLITDRDETLALVGLNLDCARKAKGSSAYIPAYDYLEKAIDLLPRNSWETDYDLTLATYTECVEVAYLKGDYARMHHLGEIALIHARTFIDKMDIYKAEINACVARQDFDAALSIGLFFQDLVLHYPASATRWDVLREYIGLKIRLFGKNIDNLGNLPEMTDPVILKILEVGASLGIALYSKAPKLLALYAILAVRDALKYGCAPEHSVCFLLYGALLISEFGDINGGCKFGEVGMKLARNPGSRKYMSMVVCEYNVLIRHWREPLRNTLDDYIDGYRYGLESGDLIYAALNLFINSFVSYMAGVPLAQIEHDIREKNSLIKALKQKQVLNVQNILWQAILNQLGRSENPVVLSGEVFDEKESLPLFRSSNNRLALAILFYIKLSLEFRFHHYEKAMACLRELKVVRKSLLGSPIEYYIPYYDALICLGMFHTMTYAQKKASLVKVGRDIKNIEKFVEFSPVNNLHRLYLVKAEYARVQGKKNQAESFYDLAIAYAREYQYIQEEAYANELAARYYFSSGREKIATRCINDAYQCYTKWGDVSKLRDLESIWGRHLFIDIHPVQTPLHGEDVDDISPTVDLQNVFQASQSISEEISYPKLLTKLVRVVLADTGAERVLFLIVRENQLIVEAEGAEGMDDVILKPAPIENHNGLSLPIVQASARAHIPVLLNNASTEGSFVADRYIVANKPKSILSFPIMHKDELIGVIYAENNGITGAFTQEHLTILNLLAAQIAISIENIRFYEHLEHTVVDRTNALKQTITELKLEEDKCRTTEEELRVSNDRLAKVLDTSSDTIIVVNQSQDIVFFNKSAENHFLYTQAEVMHQPVKRLFSRDCKNPFDRTTDGENGSLTRGRRDGLWLELKRKDGTCFKGSMTMSAFNVQGEPCYSMIIRHVSDTCTDVSADETVPDEEKQIVYHISKEQSRISERVIRMTTDISQRFSALDYVIKDIRNHLSPQHVKESELREKISRLLNLSLVIWERNTNKTKIDLAEESGIWTTYCDGGTWRTRTMDKYLEPTTIPERPRYNNVLKTADFVLNACNDITEQGEELKKSAHEIKILLSKKGYNFKTKARQKS